MLQDLGLLLGRLARINRSDPAVPALEVWNDESAAFQVLGGPSSSSSGKVLQILHATQTADNGPLTNTAWTAYPNLSQAITIVAGSNIRARLSGQMTVQNVGRFGLRIKIATSTFQIGGLYGVDGVTAMTAGVCGEVTLTDPGAGTYTVSLEYQTDSGINLYCRPATQIMEAARLTVEETA